MDLLRAESCKQRAEMPGCLDAVCLARLYLCKDLCMRDKSQRAIEGLTAELKTTGLIDEGVKRGEPGVLLS